MRVCKAEGCTVSDPLVRARASHRGVSCAQTVASRRQRAALSSEIAAACLVSALLVCGLGASALADEEATRQEMQGLDEQVQEIKSDVLGIAAELTQLEERLLYPSHTQVAVFVAMAEDAEPFRLDSVHVRIDGELVAHHIYTYKELEALQKGGVQRIHTGNVATGSHQLEVDVAGKLPNGNEIAGSQSFAFEKGVEPKLVGITLAGLDPADGGIRLGEW